MKGFLLDENLPQSIRFTPSLPIRHAAILGPSPTDAAVWDYARQQEFAIVTKDADFSDRIAFSQAPPWIVHLRIGNMRREDFHAFLARVWPQVEALLPAHKLINVYVDRIEAVS